MHIAGSQGLFLSSDSATQILILLQDLQSKGLLFSNLVLTLLGLFGIKTRRSVFLYSSTGVTQK